MSDLPSAFWGGWIVTMTVLSLVGFGWLVWSVYFTKEDKAHESPVWDETLTEGDEPAPMWWFWMTLAALVISVVYLMLFPGLGTFKGVLDWSQGGRLAKSEATYEERFGSVRRFIADMPLAELSADDVAMASADRLFDRACGICHGHEGYGQANRFPNLRDDVWQWGSTEAQLVHSIRQGRIAVMPGWQAALGDDGVANMIDYVRAMSAGSDALESMPSHGQYRQFCSACHGPQGAGNVTLGAPSLADDVWLYGDSDDALYVSIAVGRNGQMPAFDQHRLDETQLRLLLAWLMRD